MTDPQRVPAGHDPECCSPVTGSDGSADYEPAPVVPGVTRWRRKPYEVDAIQWTGENREAVAALTGAAGGWSMVPPGWYAVREDTGHAYVVDAKDFAADYEAADGPTIERRTKHG
jgi:hypothetical protein